jgi:hypothetical protein
VYVSTSHVSLIYEFRIIAMPVDSNSFILGYLVGVFGMVVLLLYTQWMFGASHGNTRAVRPAEVASVTQSAVDNA